MAYQIHLTGQEIDERLQNVGTAEDKAAADGTLYARVKKNADDNDELSDAVGRIGTAQTATNKTVTQHTSDISTLQRAVSNNKTRVENVEKVVNQHTTTINNHETRQTIIEKVVSGTQGDVYFMKSWLSLVFNDSSFNGNINNVEVKLYRWSGNRYAQFEMFTRNGTGVSQKGIGYKIILKQEKKDGANVRVPYIHYNDDGTEEELCTAVQNAFGGRISYNRSKKRRWRIQAFLNGKPITAPFDFRVSVDNNNNVSLTKGGMMRSVPASRQVKYDGYYDVNKWINCKVGEELDLNYCFFNEDLGLIRRKFPNPGDVMVENASSHTFPRGVIISVFQDTPGSYCILWSNGESIYEIGIDLDTNEYGGYNCYFPAKKLCDDIYDYASKMNSGTLRDLYIQAGAKYNEATGFYELNGLTDITEEQMRVIWQEDLSGWYRKGRTNLTRNISVKGNTGGYNGGIDISCICISNKNLQVFNLGADCFVRYMDAAFRECSNLETIDTRFRVVPYDTNLGINPFGGCIKLKDVRFDNHYLRMKATLNLYDSPLISKESVLSAITTTDNASATSAGFLTITLHADAYARLKDDADIIAALEAKNGVVTLVSA